MFCLCYASQAEAQELKADTIRSYTGRDYVYMSYTDGRVDSLFLRKGKLVIPYSYTPEWCDTTDNPLFRIRSKMMNEILSARTKELLLENWQKEEMERDVFMVIAGYDKEGKITSVNIHWSGEIDKQIGMDEIKRIYNDVIGKTVDVEMLRQTKGYKLVKGSNTDMSMLVLLGGADRENDVYIYQN